MIAEQEVQAEFYKMITTAARMDDCSSRELAKAIAMTLGMVLESPCTKEEYKKTCDLIAEDEAG